jgi:hypothetical protein
LEFLEALRFFLPMDDGGFRFDEILGGDLCSLCFFDLIDFWDSLIFGEVVDEIFVELFAIFGEVELSLCFPISKSKERYFSMKWVDFFFMAEFQ